MISTYLPYLILLVIIAAILRDDFVLTLLYLFVGIFTLGSWWSKRSIAQVEYHRKFSTHVFLGEKIKISLLVRNTGWLPVPWLSIDDALPVALISIPAFQRVTTLGSYTETLFEYELEGRKRGYYPIGPLFLSSGDLMGLGTPLRNEGQAEYLTIYPKIIPLTSIRVPSRSPQGTLRHSQPIFEDPTRIMGKREYSIGDSLRRVDWKSTASTGRLQVRQFEPSIALETLIILDLNEEDYHYHGRLDSIELAIVIAASVAAWVVGKQQTVGLKVNGKDPLAANGMPQYLPPAKGQAHLIRMLETLARVDMTLQSPLAALIQKQRYHLSWGTTLLVITGQANEEVLHELYQARKAGQNVMLILAGMGASTQAITRQAGIYGIQCVSIPDEDGLDIWRR